jgi:hypothetical protein
MAEYGLKRAQRDKILPEITRKRQMQLRIEEPSKKLKS